MVAAIKLPTDIALVFDLHLDWRVLGFALLVSFVTGIVFSLLPALQSSNLELVPALKSESSLAGFRRSRLRNALVVVQIALSLVLLVCAGLVVRSLQQAKHTRPGFTPENAVAMSFDLGLQGYSEEKGRVFERQLLERASTLPGVRSVALTSVVPLTLDYSYTSIYIEGEPFHNSTSLPAAVPYEVSPNYFRTMELLCAAATLLTAKTNRIAHYCESLRAPLLSGAEATGASSIRRRTNPTGRSRLAADGKYNSLGEEQKSRFYRPLLRDYSTTNVACAD